MISFFICSVLLITCAHSAEALKALTSELSGVAVAGIPCGTGVDECPPMTVCCSGTCWFFACAEVETEEETALAALVEKAKQKRETALAAPDEEQTVGSAGYVTYSASAGTFADEEPSVGFGWPGW